MEFVPKPPSFVHPFIFLSGCLLGTYTLAHIEAEPRREYRFGTELVWSFKAQARWN